MKRILARRCLAAVLAGTLGFGAAQALASPAPARPAEAACIDEVCNRHCEIRFGPFASGRCLDGSCVCGI